MWLITGATSGFGQQIAEKALAAGDAVVAAVRRPEAMPDLSGATPERFAAVRFDATDAARIPAVVDEALGVHGRIDVLVNNAGRGHIGAAEDTADAELRDLMELHFFGPTALTRAVLPHMRERGSGTIVQMSSMGGRLSFAGVGGYSATKFALEGWSEALAAEVAPVGIRVVIVEPGAFRTSFNGSGALRSSTSTPPYRHEMDALRASMAAADGRQPGDPVRAAAAIVDVARGEYPPLRLVLGGDAVDAVGTALAHGRDELTAWESTSRGTDFPD